MISFASCMIHRWRVFYIPREIHRSLRPLRRVHALRGTPCTRNTEGTYMRHLAPTTTNRISTFAQSGPESFPRENVATKNIQERAATRTSYQHTRVSIMTFTRLLWKVMDVEGVIDRGDHPPPKGTFHGNGFPERNAPVGGPV